MKLLLVICFATAILYLQGGPHLPQLRRLYKASAVQEDSCLKLNGLLLNVGSTSLPILVCYKGAATMVSAKYSSGPFAKLKKFRAGKELIESAIQRDTAQIEMRYLRYTLQRNVPSFLGYRNNLNADRAYLILKIESVKDPVLKDMIRQCLDKAQTKNQQKIEKQRNINRH